MKAIEYLLAPKFVDDVVQQLRLSLDTLTWLEFVYPVAEIGEDEGGTYPIIYQQDGTGEYASLLPDDTADAYAFFTDNGFDVGIEGELNTYNLSLYVWAQLGEISANINDFTMDLIGDVLAMLKENECFNFSVVTRDPFNEFTAMNEYENGFLKRKRTGFRIDFSAYGDSEGCTSNSVRPSPLPIAWGEKKTGIDGGYLWQESLTDDYRYICVYPGIPGIAIWKKIPLLSTL